MSKFPPPQEPRKCECGCGRIVTGKGVYYSNACRQRAYRNRKNEEGKDEKIKEDQSGNG